MYDNSSESVYAAFFFFLLRGGGGWGYSCVKQANLLRLQSMCYCVSVYQNNDSHILRFDKACFDFVQNTCQKIFLSVVSNMTLYSSQQEIKHVVQCH